MRPREGIMALVPRIASLAVLIDAENMSADIADGLFAQIARRGEAPVRRIYGDFSGARLQQWTKAWTRHALAPQQHSVNGGCKNASDIALVIDAMDLLHKRQFDGFCIVSSDSDFTRLAARIREDGADVFGFGRPITPQSFRITCTEFICTDALLPDSHPRSFGKRHAATPLLMDAVAQLADTQGWAQLCEVGKKVIARKPDYKRLFGHATLIKLVRATGAFEINCNGTHIRPALGTITQIAG